MFQLLQQLKSSFKRKIVRNKHQNKINNNKFYHASKTNRLFDSSYQGANRFFILNLKKKKKECRAQKVLFYIPKVDIFNYNAMISDEYFYDRQVNKITRTYGNIKKIITS